MPSRETPAQVGGRRARAIVRELGEELRRARLEHGLSQESVASAVGLSRWQAARIERGEVPRLSVYHLARLLAAVGLELTARAYPAGPPIRDEAHRRLLDRLRAQVSTEVRWRFEVPVAGAGDGRAWDAVMTIGRAQVAVEAETRLRDVQALQRRLALKLRDDARIDRVVLLVADTRANRTIVREHDGALEANLPLPARRLLASLREGVDPGASGYLLM